MDHREHLIVRDRKGKKQEEKEELQRAAGRGGE